MAEQEQCDSSSMATREALAPDRAQVPSNGDLMELATKIPQQWRELGIRLDVQLYILDSIAVDMRYQSPIEKAFEMLRMWMYTASSPTYKILIDALEKVGRLDLVRELQAAQQGSDQNHAPPQQVQAGVLNLLATQPWGSLPSAAGPLAWGQVPMYQLSGNQPMFQATPFQVGPAYNTGQHGPSHVPSMSAGPYLMFPGQPQFQMGSASTGQHGSGQVLSTPAGPSSNSPAPPQLRKHSADPGQHGYSHVSSAQSAAKLPKTSAYAGQHTHGQDFCAPSDFLHNFPTSQPYEGVAYTGQVGRGPVSYGSAGPSNCPAAAMSQVPIYQPPGPSSNSPAPPQLHKRSADPGHHGYGHVSFGQSAAKLPKTSAYAGQHTHGQDFCAPSDFPHNFPPSQPYEGVAYTCQVGHGPVAYGSAGPSNCSAAAMGQVPIYQLPGNEASLQKKLPQALENQVTELEAILKDEYRTRASTYVTPFPWLEDWQLVLDDIFIKVRMVERESQRFGELRDEERGMYDIFEPHEHCNNPKFVLVEGAPGIGKTVFCQKLATDWAKGQTGASFPDFRIVLNLKCRDILSTSGNLDRKALEDSIVDQLLPLDAPDGLKTALFEYVKTPGCGVLLVLDGLDEFKGAVDLAGLGTQLRSWHCKFLFTSRNDPKLRKSCDSLYQIVGFTPKDAESYINKFFGQDESEMAALLVSQIKDGRLLRDLVTNPLSTSLLCFVCNETGGKLPVSKAKLYEELVCCVLRRKHKKNGQEPPEDPLATHQEDLALLGRLALKGIEKGQLHFRNDEFNAEGRATDVLHFGFLSEEKSTSKRINSPSCHQFVHKTVQEFFAALHLCVELLSADSENCLRRLGGMSEDELLRQYKQVLSFLSSMLSEKGEQRKPAASRFFSSLARREGDDGGDFGGWIVDLVHECAAVNAEFGEAMIHPVVSSWAVKRLNLARRQMTEADVRLRVACAVVKANRPLEVLYLTSNNIRDLSRLSAALRTNTSLRELLLRGNPQLTAESVGGLAAALAQHTGLETLWLDGKFSGEPAIQNLQEQKPRLRIVFIR